MFQKLFFCILFGLLIFPNISAAHFIVGLVNDAYDGTVSNDNNVLIWNPSNGLSDNLTDIIGVNGNSHTSQVYMVDCELLSSPCNIGDTLDVVVYDGLGNFISENASVTVTGAGYDLVGNITINSEPSILSVFVDDGLAFPLNEIDLVAGFTRDVKCSSVVEELDGDVLKNVSVVFFDSTNSFVSDFDDHNFHYTNNTCDVNSGYGTQNQSQINCTFEVWYYANSGSWECFLNVSDNLSSSSSSDSTFINSFLSINITSILNFGAVDPGVVSDEATINVSNVGNVRINLSLSGYAVTEGDGYAMNCSAGSIKNISVENEKYNSTSSNPGQLSLSEVESTYNNLSSSVKVNSFNLNSRQNDTFNEAVNSTYWRMFIPVGVAGSCSGNLVFGASLLPES